MPRRKQIEKKKLQRVRKMMRNVKWELAIIAGGRLISKLDVLLESPFTSQEIAKTMAIPETQVGMLVQGPWVRKNDRRPRTYFVSFDKNAVFEIQPGEGSLKPSRYIVLESQLITPFMTRALAKIASVMSDDLQI
jgi:hypothetical protein